MQEPPPGNHGSIASAGINPASPHSPEQALKQGELEEVFRVGFGYRPMLTYRVCQNGENFEQALRDAIRTGSKGNIRDADWHARMADDGLCID